MKSEIRWLVILLGSVIAVSPLSSSGVESGVAVAIPKHIGVAVFEVDRAKILPWLPSNFQLEPCFQVSGPPGASAHLLAFVSEEELRIESLGETRLIQHRFLSLMTCALPPTHWQLSDRRQESNWYVLKNFSTSVEYLEFLRKTSNDSELSGALQSAVIDVRSSSSKDVDSTEFSFEAYVVSGPDGVFAKELLLKGAFSHPQGIGRLTCKPVIRVGRGILANHSGQKAFAIDWIKSEAGCFSKVHISGVGNLIASFEIQAEKAFGVTGWVDLPGYYFFRTLGGLDLR